MVFLEYPNGGAVFSSSAIAWCGSLSYNNYTNNVSRITENVLRRFASDAPLAGAGGAAAADAGLDVGVEHVSSAREDFLRRYATSPIHVPRLERFLDAYGGDGQDEAFALKFIDWDRACADVDAARIVTEIVSVSADETGRPVRLSDDAVRGAIRWMAEATSLSVADRAELLREGLASRDRTAGEG